MTRRRTEVVVAGAALLASAGFTAAVLIWHFGLDDAWWSLPLPSASAWNGFGIYPWANLILSVTFLAVCLCAAFSFAIGRRRLAASILLLTLPALTAAGCAAVYWPLHSTYVSRVDRILRMVKEPAFAYRRIAVLLASTLLLSLIYSVMASLRRAPPAAPAVARVTIAVLAGLYLHILWVPMILPPTNRWDPVEWERPEVLTAFRPCRGALLWFTRDDGKIIPFGRIDDLWLRFADPRQGRTARRAISVEMDLREDGYAWLQRAEANQFLVRRDDPAVVRCDSRWRTESVAAATWHTLGVKW